MPIDPQAPAARIQRFIAVFCAIVFVIAVINLVAGSNAALWIAVAVVSGIAAAVLARSFEMFRRKEY